MPMAEYTTEDQKKAEVYVGKITDAALSGKGGATLDSVNEGQLIEAIEASDTVVPSSMQIMLDECEDSSEKAKLNKAVLDGIAAYEYQHGEKPLADVISYALHQGMSTTRHAENEMSQSEYKFDSASSDHHDQHSLQISKAIVAVTGSVAEAIPFAHYLPVGIKSNQAKLIIVSHQAGSSFGEYSSGEIMDGTNIGKQYASSSRFVDVTDGATKIVTSKMSGEDTFEAPDDAAKIVPVKLLRGRTLVYVGGLRAGGEASSTKADSSPVAGEVTINGDSYAVSGSVKPDTGEVTITVTPPVPAGMKVTAEVFTDYEKMPQLAPRIITEAESYTVTANPSRIYTEQTEDTRTQFTNELGLSIQDTSMLAVRNQVSNERHYHLIQMAHAVGKTFSETFDFKWPTNGINKSIADNFQSIMPLLSRMGQRMANRTMDHGITHLYVGDQMMSIINGLPSTMFKSSGVRELPGIYRIGKLFGKYDVYYNPRMSSAIETSAQILCIGKSNKVARNPYLIGDAVAPIIEPLPHNKDYTRGATYYSRGFTTINPHTPSALGCAIIDVINLPGLSA